MTNTAWKTDNIGKYIEFDAGTMDIEISFDFKNLLLEDEHIQTITYNTILDVVSTQIFGFTSHQTIAIITFGVLPTTAGVFDLEINILTTQNRIYNQHARVKIK